MGSIKLQDDDIITMCLSIVQTQLESQDDDIMMMFRSNSQDDP